MQIIKKEVSWHYMNTQDQVLVQFCYRVTIRRHVDTQFYAIFPQTVAR